MKENLNFLLLRTYLNTNSSTGRIWLRPMGCICQSALNTRWTGLKVQMRRKPPPHPPTELWLICRELVENLDRVISCQIIWTILHCK